MVDENCDPTFAENGARLREEKNRLSGLCDKWPLTLGFAFLGAVTLLAPNGLFNSLASILEYRFRDQVSAGSLFVAMFQTGSIVAAIITMFQKGGGIRPALILTTMILQIVSFSLILLTLQAVPMTHYLSPAVFACCLAFVGACCGAAQTSGMALSANFLDASYLSAYYAGMGLAGIITFVSWTLISASFPKSMTITIFYIMLAVLTAWAIVWLWLIQSHPRHRAYLCSIIAYHGGLRDARVGTLDDLTSTQTHENKTLVSITNTHGSANGSAVAQSRDSGRDVTPSRTGLTPGGRLAEHESTFEFSGADLLPSTSGKQIDESFCVPLAKALATGKECAPELFVIFICYLVTMAVFPAIGPLLWAVDSQFKQILIGCFQVADFFARVLSSLRSCKRRALMVPTSLLRLTFCPLFLFAAEHPQSRTWLISLIIALGASNGWLSSAAFASLPGRVPRKESQSAAAALGTPTLLAGLLTGSWLANLVIPFL